MSASTTLERWRARHRDGGLVLRLALVLLALQTAWRSLVTFDSYFWQDDFRYLADARALGLSTDYLLQDYNGHVMPAQFFLVWLVSRAQFSFVLPAVSLVVLQLVASTLMLWVLWSLWPRRPEILIGYAVFLFSPLGLVAGTWWAAGLQALPLQCAMLLALGSVVADHRAPRWRWKTTTVLALVLGLLFWEKAILVIPLLVLVQVLLLDDADWTDRRAVLRRHRAEWSVWLAIGVVYTAVYVAMVRGQSSAGAQASYDDFVVNAVIKMLLPGILGGPWTDAGGENTVYPAPETFALALATTVVVLGIGWAWSRSARVTGRALLLVGGYLAMDLGLVLVARSDFVALLARDPRYVTDALPVVAIALTSVATTGAGLASRSAGPGGRAHTRWTLGDRAVQVCASASAVLVASSWISVQALQDQLSHRYAREYVVQLLAEQEALPDAVIVDASAPPIGVVAQPVSVVFAAADRRPRFDEASADLRMADGFGLLEPVSVPDAEWQATGPAPGCGWPARTSLTRLFTTSGPPGMRRVVQLGYYAEKATALLVQLSPVEGPRYVAAPAGLGYLWLVTRAEIPLVAFLRPAGTAGLCVTDVRIGAPWPGR